jgi:hypothetical protein
MLVRTVTPIINGAGRPSLADDSRAARAAACIIALPPDAWTLIIHTGGDRRFNGLFNVFGSRDVQIEEDAGVRRVLRTSAGPSLVKRRWFILNPPASPRSVSTSRIALAALDIQGD